MLVKDVFKLFNSKKDIANEVCDLSKFLKDKNKD